MIKSIMEALHPNRPKVTYINVRKIDAILDEIADIGEKRQQAISKLKREADTRDEQNNNGK